MKQNFKNNLIIKDIKERYAQRISIAIQRGNAASLLSTLPMSIGEEEFYNT
jgi:hypothetical protein